MDRLTLRPALDIVTTEDAGGAVQLLLRGELDCSTASMLRRRIRDEIAAGTSMVVLDVRLLSFLDAAGLGVLVGAHRQLREQGGGLVVRAAPPPVRRVLEITGLDSLLDHGQPCAGADDPHDEPREPSCATLREDGLQATR